MFRGPFHVLLYVLYACNGAQDITPTTLFSSDQTVTDIKSTLLPSTNNVRTKFYAWTKDDALVPLNGRALQDHVILSYSGKQNVGQCALECLKVGTCESFNYEHTTGLCELNNSSHVGHEDDLIAYSSKDFYLRNTFSIDKGGCHSQEALGVCSGNPCSSRGRCLEIRNSAGTLSPLCQCNPGWQGRSCSDQALGPQWSVWSEWSVCSVTCSSGWQKRQRYCRDESTQQSANPSLCAGGPIQYRTCLLQECPRWTTWGAWGECSTSTTCGEGIQTKRRSCSNGGTIGVDRFCLGLDTQTTPCLSVECFGPLRFANGSGPSEGRIELYDNINKNWTLICANQMTEFVAFLACRQAGWPGAYTAIKDGRYGNGNGNLGLKSLQCKGTEKSLASCTHNLWTTNAKCSDDTSIPGAVQCNVNGVWSLWSAWSDCSVTCENGTRTRIRKCDQPKTMYNGIPCQGASTEQKSCSLSLCPVDGLWTSWGTWSSCSEQCGNGTQSRLRECIGPFHGGHNCSGNLKEIKVCKDKECPIDGQWNDWSSWLECSQTCGVGKRSRSRVCSGPYFDGQPCLGTSIDVTDCLLQNCPVDGEWLQWNAWTQCTLSCGGGHQSRQRQCQQPLFGGSHCLGPGNESQSCSQQNCPIDGYWNPWSAWSACSATCGLGGQIRNRTCQGPYYGGANCTGNQTEAQNCSLQNCPVDGQWLEWQSWSVCSASCGGGKKVRKRVCYFGLYGGSNCTGASIEELICNENLCPVNGQWLPWSSWGQCSLSCGNGSQSRVRQCNGPFNGGANCSGISQESQSCNNQSCAVDGVWEMWSKWSQCNVTCGGGLQQRSRNCTGPFYGGKVCDGIANDFQNCNNQNCPEDGVLSPWSTWGDCSRTCGGGVKERHRICIGPFYGGRYCEGVLVDNITCNSQDCPVDGILTSWTSWSQCSATCMGTQSRNRTCVGPFYGGKDCQSHLIESQPCNNVSCAVDGTWTVWSEWSPCSLSCGGGSRTRSRKCVGILNGGKNCDGNSEERQLCNSEGCPVDGFFGQWSSWGLCSLTCGSGIQLRNRTCIGPFNGGKNCSGNFEDSQTCNQQSCPIDGYYLQWSEWGVCSATCGGGVQYRNRTCVQPLYGGQNCQGVNSESQACSTNPCPVDGYYSEWGVWSQCSVSCGGGSYWRTRSCVPPKNGGLDCIGPANVTDSCNYQPCPIDGVWLSWSVWSACSTTCGGGKQTRTRLCEEPKYGGKLCEGPKAEYLNCSDNPCPIPGLWLPWSPWTPCSATCGGGTHVRDRLCNTTSFGNLTDPCPGSSRENASCHTFNCLPLARTCTELGQRGLVESTMADIDPDGPTLYSLEPVSVYCDMVSNNGTGVTVLGHNQEAKTEVQGWEGAREYQADLIYNVSFDHAISIVDQSSNCEQYIRWECFAALIHNYNDNNKITTGWLNRTKGVADYFGDAPPGSNNCTCGTKNACADKSFGCNCDSNDHVWRVDDGYMTYKDDLPVYAFVAGDTGGQDEDGFSQVGPLRCYGTAKVDLMKKALVQWGHYDVGALSRKVLDLLTNPCIYIEQCQDGGKLCSM